MLSIGGYLLLLSFSNLKSVVDLNIFGRNSTMNRERNVLAEHDVISILANSVEFLAKRRIGALIVIERGVKLDELITPSTIISGEISQELLTTIFVPTTPYMMEQ